MRLLEKYILYPLTFLVFCNAQIVWADSGIPNQTICNASKIEELDQCWSKLPHTSVNGMPTDPNQIEIVCRIFNTGIRCLENWTKVCLQAEARKKVRSSVVGAIETYKFLCTDVQFQEKYLQHADCYNRISPHWDACTKKFISTLVRIDHAVDVLSLCCVRFRYQQCLTKVAISFCSANATSFLKDLANSMMKSTLKNYDASRCNNFNYKRCKFGAASSAQSFTHVLSKTQCPLSP